MYTNYLTAITAILVSAVGVSALIGHKDDEVISYFRRTNGITSGDGCYTIALSGNRTIWFFGDSHVDDISKDGSQPCFFQARNAALVQPINDWTQNNSKSYVGPNTHFKSLFKATNDTANWYWTGHGIQLSDTVYVYCAELENMGGGKMGFKNTGNDHWCKMDPAHLTVTGYTKLQSFNGINFGVGFVPGNQKDQDDFIYGFGERGNGQIFGRSLFVSRLYKTKPENSWEFWDGSAWVNDVHKSHSVLDEQGGGVSVNKVRNKYLVLSTDGSVQCNQGKTIYARLSDHVTGPYTQKKAIHTIEETKVNNTYPFFYFATSHPELTNSKNELLITYSINGYEPCFKDCINGRLNPDYYRLRGVRVNIDELFKLF